MTWDDERPSAGASLSARAVTCTAHLMMLQNPRADIHTRADWVIYMTLVREWCEVQEINGVRYYWHAAMTEPGKLN